MLRRQIALTMILAGLSSGCSQTHMLSRSSLVPGGTTPKSLRTALAWPFSPTWGKVLLTSSESISGSVTHDPESQTFTVITKDQERFEIPVSDIREIRIRSQNAGFRYGFLIGWGFGAAALLVSAVDQAIEGEEWVSPGGHLLIIPLAAIVPGIIPCGFIGAIFGMEQRFVFYDPDGEPPMK